jgi:hypothetical protein
MTRILSACIVLLCAACPLQSPVEANSADISFSGGSVSPGGTTRLTDPNQPLTVTAADAHPVAGAAGVWSSSDPAVATVSASADGLTATITPLKDGTTVIDFTLGNKLSSFTVVVQLVVAASVVLTGPDQIDAHVVTGYSAVLMDAQNKPLNGATVKWSAASGVIAVAPAGNSADVTGNQIGTTTLVASYPGAQQASKTVIVNPVSIEVSPVTVDVKQSPSKTQTLPGQATLRAKDGQGVIVSIAPGTGAGCPAGVPLCFGGGLTETHSPADPPIYSFNFYQPLFNAEGSLQLIFYDISKPPATHTVTLTALGKTTNILTVNTVP